jgi:hypothetical protein
MTFVEADAQYEVVKQQYLAGMLDDEQYDEQLHRLMVLDEAGLWWAKSRENGSWHYYDTTRGNWVAASPPGGSQLPPPLPLPGASPKDAKDKRQKSGEPAKGHTKPAPGAKGTEGAAGGENASAAAAAPRATTPGQGKSGESNLPRWAAVKPGGTGAAPVTSATASATAPTTSRGAGAPAPGPAGTKAQALPGTAQGAPGTSGYSAHDFSPIPDLTGSMKVLFYILSLFLPLLGLILYFFYRNKPAEADRAAARVFLILGIVSVVFTAMCITTFVIFESLMLGTGI